MTPPPCSISIRPLQESNSQLEQHDPAPIPTNKFRTNRAFQFLTESTGNCEHFLFNKGNCTYRQNVQGVSWSKSQCCRKTGPAIGTQPREPSLSFHGSPDAVHRAAGAQVPTGHSRET